VSQENVAVLRAFFSAWNAGDMDALCELHDPSVIMHAPEGWPEPGPEVGRDAVMRQFERLRGAFDADSVQPIGDLIDAGDRVLVRLVWRTTGRGPQSQMEVTHVATVRDGKIILNAYYWDHAAALKAVGLEE
jgi:ketosteroid isomerase-like protein